MSSPNAKANGQLRNSQIITTFGPGSMIDLPNQSVIVGGLEHWQGVKEAIIEPRLLEKLKRLLGVTNLKLFAPPVDQGIQNSPMTGITAWQFPEWFVTQEPSKPSGTTTLRSRMLVHRKRLTKGKFIDENRKKLSVVPVRFVRACRLGHIADIDWYWFVHSQNKECRQQLWIDELGTSGDLSELEIRCQCGERRPLYHARIPGNLAKCFGERPWLGGFNREECSEMNRFLIRHASNAYFPQVMSVISLPSRSESLEKAVNQVWETDLQYAEDISDVAKDRRRKPHVKAALENFTDEEIFDEIQIRKGLELEGPGQTVKEAEFEVLSKVKESSGEDVPDGVFYARALPKKFWSGSEQSKHMSGIEQVVMVHRLREVVAQVGFTRFEASSPDTHGELEVGVQRASLAREIEWLPAIENRGEGIFIQFRTDAVDKWASQQSVLDYEERLKMGFDAWMSEHPGSRKIFPGVKYYMLHSLSHLLLTAVALECGYPSSALHERVYHEDGGYGILLHTGTSDSEGTLGGLVQTGKNLRHYILKAMELGRLCSNDPVCAQHDPRQSGEGRHLHGASCHGCLLIAEPCCEQHNDFLDRSLVIPTVENLGVEFFRSEGW